MMDSTHSAPRKRAARLLGGTFLVYALLVALHLGEFWPFSIYPMFSTAGGPWSRAAVRDISQVEGRPDWTPVLAAELPGTAFASVDHGFDHTDLANYVSKTKRWDQDRVDGLRSVFGHTLEGRRLLVYRVDGRFVSEDSILVEYRPYLLMEEDTTFLNPELPR